LRWIQENISNFGGDPENVTIVGESAGAGSVSLLPVIKGTEGLFQKVIAESGSVALTYSKEECQGLTRRLLKESGAESIDKLINLSEEQIKKINESLNEYNNFPMRDGKIIPENIYQAYKDGEANDVDILIGTNADEANYWINEVGGIAIYKFLIPVMYENNISRLTDEDMKKVKQFRDYLDLKNVWEITEFYNEVLFRVPAIAQAESHADNGGNTYMYYWTYPSVLENMGACHAVELAYVFNNLSETITTGDNIDVNLANTVQEMWTNFVRNGNPSTSSLEWKQYDSTSRKTMILGSECYIENSPLNEQRQLIEPILKYHFNGAYANLSFNVPYIYKIVLGVLLVIICTIILIKKILHKNSKQRSPKE